jgi:hypothetical protein
LAASFLPHLIQDAQQTGLPLQLTSLDIEKAFDKLSHAIITQALRAFRIPEFLTKTMQNYVLVGLGKVEVNNRKGLIDHNQDWIWTGRLKCYCRFIA